MSDCLGLLFGLRIIGRQTLLRLRRGGFIHCGLNLVGDFFSGFLEFLDALAEAFGKFRQFPGSEKDQDEREDENNLTAAQIKQPEHGIHT